MKNRQINNLSWLSNCEIWIPLEKLRKKTCLRIEFRHREGFKMLIWRCYIYKYIIFFFNHHHPSMGVCNFDVRNIFFSFSPSKADAITFKEGFMTLSLCQTGHSRTQFYFHFVDCRNSLVNENLRGNQRLVFSMLFLQNLPQPLARLCRIWTNSSKQVVLNVNFCC